VITNTPTSRPTLGSAGADTTLTLSGTLTGSGQRFIDVYASPATTTGNQGQVYLGRITVTSGTSFNGTVRFSAGLGVTAGWKITATVTSTAGGNLVTSDFSAAVAAVAGTAGGGVAGSPGVANNPRPPSRLPPR
jgi:hypothetical protein